MARFLIVLAIVLGCIYLIITKTDWNFENKYQYQARPIKKEKIFDFEGARQKGIERQRRINEGRF